MRATRSARAVRQVAVVAAATSLSTAAADVHDDCGALVILRALSLAAASGQFVVTVVVKVANATSVSRFLADLAAAPAASVYSHCALVKQGGALCSPRKNLQLIGQSVPKRQPPEVLMTLDREFES